MKPSPLPLGLPLPSFSVKQAKDAEVPIGRLRAADLESPFHGVRSVSHPEGLLERCLAYRNRMADDQFFSHVTAAALYGVPLPLRLERHTKLDVTGRTQRPRLEGVRGFRSLSTPTQVVNGLLVTEVTHLLGELASVLSHEDLVIAADALTRRKHPPSSLFGLTTAAYDQHSRGIRAVRDALVDARPGTDSPMETRVRLLIQRAGLPEPVIHLTIFDAAGDFVGTPDMSYAAERIAMEYEGTHHRDDPLVFADDIERRERMQEAGWYVIRIIADHVFREPAQLANRIRRVLIQRAVA
jgi:hypothetical protein